MSIVAKTGDPKAGRAKMDWAFAYMPVLSSIQKRFKEEKPLEGLKISLSIHLEAKTANLATVLRDGGAEVCVTGSNPLSTQDDIVAALHADGFEVYAVHGVDDKTYMDHIRKTLHIKPHIIVDDGGDLLSLLHDEAKEDAINVIGGCEETTTGVLRMIARDKAGMLNFPMMAVNDARCKHLFDNRYGTGQSVWDSIMRNTNLLIAGCHVVVAGYGWCGRGVAMRAASLGAKVIVCEVDPVKALEASMDGYDVMSMHDAAPLGDIFVTVTGCNDVIRREHMERMKSGALLTNAGHFDVEVNVKDLKALAVDVVDARPNVKAYVMSDGRRLNLIGEGRLVNLAAADGHPVEIMDLSFAVQALGVEYIAKHHKKLDNKVYNIPDAIDDEVAKIKLESLGLGYDTLSEEQKAYLAGWEA